MKDNVKRMRKKATDWEKILAKHTGDKELLPQVHKELLKLNNKETNNPINKWAEGLSKKEKKGERIHGNGQQCIIVGGGGKRRG